VYELGYIVMVKFELRQLKQVLNIFKTSCDQIIHRDYVIAIVDKTIAEMRTQETGSASD
jgi:hypothetical protein